MNPFSLAKNVELPSDLPELDDPDLQSPWPKSLYMMGVDCCVVIDINPLEVLFFQEDADFVNVKDFAPCFLTCEQALEDNNEVQDTLTAAKQAISRADDDEFNRLWPVIFEALDNLPFAMGSNKIRVTKAEEQNELFAMTARAIDTFLSSGIRATSSNLHVFWQKRFGLEQVFTEPGEFRKYPKLQSFWESEMLVERPTPTSSAPLFKKREGGTWCSFINCDRYLSELMVCPLHLFLFTEVTKEGSENFSCLPDFADPTKMVWARETMPRRKPMDVSSSFSRACFQAEASSPPNSESERSG